MDAVAVIRILDIILLGMERSEAITRKFNEAKQFVQSLNGREPTEEEWSALRSRLALAEATIEERAQSARDAME